MKKLTFMEKLLSFLGVPKSAQDAVKNANSIYRELSYEESLKASVEKLIQLDKGLIDNEENML